MRVGPLNRNLESPRRTGDGRGLLSQRSPGAERHRGNQGHQAG
jgi:hypothetical protein